MRIYRFIVMIILTLVLMIVWGDGLRAKNAAYSKVKNNSFEYVPCSELKLGIDESESWSGLRTAKEVFKQRTERRAKEGKDYKCGYLTVPEQHSQPKGKKIKLGVATIESTNPSPLSEPLVMLQGGPGGSGISNFSNLANPENLTGRRLRQESQLIILEQRGTLFSQPTLFCEELNRVVAEPNADTEQVGQNYKSATEKCKKRLEQRGINISAYNSIENADDVELLAKALQLKKINLYGSSYGSRLAFHVLRRHPEILGSLILDGVYPLPVDSSEEKARTHQRLFEQIYLACNNNDECKESYGDIKTKLLNVIDRLNQSPVTIELLPTVSNAKPVSETLDGNNIALQLIQISKPSLALPLLPALITQLDKGKYELLETILSLNYESLETQKSDKARGMYLSVMCGENDYNYQNLDLDGVWLPIMNSVKMENKWERESCQVLGVPKLDVDAIQPLQSDKPILLMNGNLDHVTPPTFAYEAAKTLSQKWIVDFPAKGHGVLNNSCGSAIAAEFLRRPNSLPNISCAEEGKVEFVTKKRLLAQSAVIFFKVSEWKNFSTKFNLFDNSGIILIGYLGLLFGLLYLVCTLPRQSWNQKVFSVLGSLASSFLIFSVISSLASELLILLSKGYLLSFW